VKLHVSALRFVFVKTLKRSYLPNDIPYLKVPRRLPTILTAEEVTRLIDAARTLTDRTMLIVLYSTGMRNAEMRHLQVRDIDSTAMLIHLQHGKGGRDGGRTRPDTSVWLACTNSPVESALFPRRQKVTGIFPPSVLLAIPGNSRFRRATLA
jgi:integrase